MNTCTFPSCACGYDVPMCPDYPPKKEPQGSIHPFFEGVDLNSHAAIDAKLEAYVADLRKAHHDELVDWEVMYNELVAENRRLEARLATVEEAYNDLQGAQEQEAWERL